MEVEGDWACSLTKLWRFNKQDSNAEARYNYRMSQRAPYCSVCSMLNQSDDVSIGLY